MTFGSVNRGDHDDYSDVDLLIVYPNDRLYDHSKYEQYSTNPKYSISYYNSEKLQWLSSKGSLFIKHLKVSGEIVIDDNDVLSKILDSFQQKTNYDAELASAYRFKDLLSVMPRYRLVNGWVCDVLYIAIRNALVYMSANTETFEFGYKTLISIYKDRYGWGEADIDALYKLRIIKTAYRAKPHFLPVDEVLMQSIMCSASKMFDSLSYARVSDNDYRQYVKNSLADPSISPYGKFKLLEGLYNLSTRHDERFEKIFTMPQFYASRAKEPPNLQLWFDRIIDNKYA